MSGMTPREAAEKALQQKLPPEQAIAFKALKSDLALAQSAYENEMQQRTGNIKWAAVDTLSDKEEDVLSRNPSLQDKKNKYEVAKKAVDDFAPVVDDKELKALKMRYESYVMDAFFKDGTKNDWKADDVFGADGKWHNNFLDATGGLYQARIDGDDQYSGLKHAQDAYRAALQKPTPPPNPDPDTILRTVPEPIPDGTPTSKGTPGAIADAGSKLDPTKTEEVWFGKGPLETLAIILSGNLASPLMHRYLTRPIMVYGVIPLSSVVWRLPATIFCTGVMAANMAMGDKQRANNWGEAAANQAWMGAYGLVQWVPNTGAIARDIFYKATPLYMDPAKTWEDDFANYNPQTGQLKDPNKYTSMSNAQKDAFVARQKEYNKNNNSDKEKSAEKQQSSDVILKQSDTDIAPVNEYFKAVGSNQQTISQDLIDRAKAVVDAWIQAQPDLPKLDPRKIQDVVKEIRQPDPMSNAAKIAFAKGEIAFKEHIKSLQPTPYIMGGQQTPAPAAAPTPVAEPNTTSATLGLSPKPPTTP